MAKRSRARFVPDKYSTCQVPITGNGNGFHFHSTFPVNEPFKISVLHLPFILKAALVPLVTTARGEQRNNSSGKASF